MSTGSNSSPKATKSTPTYHGTPMRSGHPIGKKPAKTTTMPAPKKGS